MEKVFCAECNKKVDYKIEERTIKEFKGREVNVIEQVAVCNVCKNDIYVPVLERENFKLLYDKYRELEDLVKGEDIVAFREEYDLSQRELTAILNWGKMTINRFERGAVPSKSHSDFLRIVFSYKNIFADIVKRAYDDQRINESTYNKIIEKIGDYYTCDNKRCLIESLTNEESIYTGRVRFNIDKLINLISYIADKAKVYMTSLNKYLWYIDFENFKRFGNSITGLTYARYTYGPIIEGFKYKSILEAFDDKFYTEDYELADKVQTLIKSKCNYDLSIFSEKELQVINKVIDRFKGMSSSEITSLSHKEDAWNENNNRDLISYKYAYKLKVEFD